MSQSKNGQPHPCQMTVNGICHNLPVDAAADASYDVSFLNGHAEIDLVLGLLETGAELVLRITDPAFLDHLVYRAMLAQSRLANAMPLVVRAA